MKIKYPILLASASVLTAVLLVTATLAVPTSQADDDDTLIFFAVLNSGQEFPPFTPPAGPSTSNAFGVALLTFNEDTKMLCFSISYTGLVAPEVAAHFHAPAPPGAAAGVTIGLTSPGTFPLGSPRNGCVGPLTDQQGEDLKDGLFYINIHTFDPATGGGFPGGEIRGQVLPLDD